MKKATFLLLLGVIIMLAELAKVILRYLSLS